MNFKDKVIYQIYPKSFKDSNGDGYGDLNGILDKLDYLQALGIDYIWINPIFVSPQNDNGYDIENYYEIDPMFGTMEDFENLIQEAAKRNIYFMLDMVFNHTSTNHEWFQKALTGDPEYKNRYIFKKGKDGNPPTNWESKFKGNAWQYVEALDEYYLHLFHVTQADVNWKNKKVREEAAKIVNFWIEKGIKGFRFDVINLIDKICFENDEEGDGRVFYVDGKNVYPYLKELNKQTFGRYDDIITVGELSSTTIEQCARYTSLDHSALSMAFNFHHLKVDMDPLNPWNVVPFDFQKLKSIFNEWQVKQEEHNAWSAVFWCCHDQPRIVSRFGDDRNFRKESAKMLGTLIHMMRGTPYIYQGEEIGMCNPYFTSLDMYRDIDSLNSYHKMDEEGISEVKRHQFLQYRSRDNARTPMQWSQDENTGFSVTKPWIDVNKDYRDINVANALQDSDSVLYYYQKLIQLRKQYTVIQNGSYHPMMEDHPTIFAYKRTDEEQELVVYANFYGKEETIDIDVNGFQILLSNVHRVEITSSMRLQPYEALVLIKK